MTDADHTQEKIIRSWNDCAAAYDEFIQRWPIFTEMADALLARLPADLEGTVLDIGGGSGLAAERALNRFPQAKLILAEPAPVMRALAAQRLGDRIDLRAAPGEQVDDLGILADAALCNAALHLMDENKTLPAVASVLRPGAVFAANLWGHSFDETAPLDDEIDWFGFMEQALRELKLPAQPRPKHQSARLRSADGLRTIARRCGLELVEVGINIHEIESRFTIEFAVMRGALRKAPLAAEERRRVIERALELCSGAHTISWVDLLFKRT